MNRHLKKNYFQFLGFTLLELLVYMALLTLMLTVLFTSSTALENTALFIQTKTTHLRSALDADHADEEGLHTIP